MRRKPKSFTKESISRRVAKEHDLSLDEARALMNTVVASMVETLSGGETVKISGLATFSVVERGPRRYRNPRTGEYFNAPAKSVVRVNTSKVLEDKVAELPA